VSTTNYTCKTQASLYSLFLTGANALIDRKKILEIGCFDEIFNPYYGEDVDLGLRAWRLGHKCYYEHNAVCRHPNSATIKKEPVKKIKIISSRNKMYLHFIHLNNFELFYYLVMLFFKTILRALLFDTKYLKSSWLFISSLNKCLSSKKRIRVFQKLKKVNLSVRDIVVFIKENTKTLEIDKF